MKRSLIFIAVLVLLAVCPPASAASTLNEIIFVAGSKDCVVNNSIYHMAAAPYLENGRVLVPHTAAAKAFGIDEKDVLWDRRGKTIEIRASDVDLKFIAGEKVFYVDGEPRQIDVAPSIREGQIFLPVKWIAEALGYEAAWDGKSQSILLGPPGKLPLWKPFPATVLNSQVRACEFSGDSLHAVNKLSSSSIVFVGEYSNVFNAGVAAGYANGFILEPNRVFSFDQVVGERSAERGYINGYDILENLTIGGGVCRTSTVLYQAACGAGLEIIERHPHYKPVHYTLVGTDASVNWGTMDLRFRNNLQSPILVKAGLDEGEEGRRLWAEFWEGKPLPKARLAVLRKEPGMGVNYRDNLEAVQLTAVVKYDMSYVSLEQLSDLLRLPLEVEETDGLRLAVLGLNNTQSARFISNNNNAVVNNNEFRLSGSPLWLPECSCKFWIPLRDWATIIGADVHWIDGPDPMAVLNLSVKQGEAGEPSPCFTTSKTRR